MQRRHRRCASYGLDKYRDALEKHLIAPHVALDTETWYCWQCAPGSQFRTWLHFHDEGFPVLLPLRADRASYPHIAVPAFGAYGLIALDLGHGRSPTQDHNSPSWRLIPRYVETERLGRVAVPQPVRRAVVESLRARMQTERVKVPGDGPSEWTDGLAEVIDDAAIADVFSLHKGDAVVVTGDQLAGRPGKVIWSDGQRVRALLDLMGLGQREVTLPRSAVEKVNKAAV